MKKIVAIMIKDLEKRMKKLNINIKVTENIINHIKEDLINI